MASLEASNHFDPSNNQSAQPGSNSNTESIPFNPFFLSSSKNLDNILVTQPLLGMQNYHSWSRAMVLALTAKKKIEFVNGKTATPWFYLG